MQGRGASSLRVRIASKHRWRLTRLTPTGRQTMVRGARSFGDARGAREDGFTGQACPESAWVTVVTALATMALRHARLKLRCGVRWRWTR